MQFQQWGASRRHSSSQPLEYVRATEESQDNRHDPSGSMLNDEDMELYNKLRKSTRSTSGVEAHTGCLSFCLPLLTTSKSHQQQSSKSKDLPSRCGPASWAVLLLIISSLVVTFSLTQQVRGKAVQVRQVQLSMQQLAVELDESKASTAVLNRQIQALQAELQEGNGKRKKCQDGWDELSRRYNKLSLETEKTKADLAKLQAENAELKGRLGSQQAAFNI